MAMLCAALCDSPFPSPSIEEHATECRPLSLDIILPHRLAWSKTKSIPINRDTVGCRGARDANGAEEAKPTVSPASIAGARPAPKPLQTPASSSALMTAPGSNQRRASYWLGLLQGCSLSSFWAPLTNSPIFRAIFSSQYLSLECRVILPETLTFFWHSTQPLRLGLLWAKPFTPRPAFGIQWSQHESSPVPGILALGDQPANNKRASACRDQNTSKKPRREGGLQNDPNYNDDGGGGNDELPNDGSVPRPLANQQTAYACHFFVKDPQKHQRCITFKANSYPHVKQHLKRVHKISKYHCEQCNMTWVEEKDDAEKNYNDHTRNGRCGRPQSLDPEKLSVEDFKRCTISGRSQRKGDIQSLSDYDKWYWTWDKLPFGPRPPSPYHHYHTDALYTIAARRQATNAITSPVATPVQTNAFREGLPVIDPAGSGPSVEMARAPSMGAGEQLDSVPGHGWRELDNCVAPWSEAEASQSHLTAQPVTGAGSFSQSQNVSDYAGLPSQMLNPMGGEDDRHDSDVGGFMLDDRGGAMAPQDYHSPMGFLDEFSNGDQLGYSVELPAAQPAGPWSPRCNSQSQHESNQQPDGSPLVWLSFRQLNPSFVLSYVRDIHRQVETLQAGRAAVRPTPAINAENGQEVGVSEVDRFTDEGLKVISDQLNELQAQIQMQL